MEEVSCRATRMLVEAMESLGMDPACLVEGLPVSLEQLRDPSEHIDWDVFAAVNDNVARKVGSPLALERVGERIVSMPSYEFLRRVAGHVVTPRQVYMAGVRFLMPLLYPNIDITATDVAEGRMRLEVAIPAGMREAGSFFHICTGALSAVATLLGQPPALVDAQITGHTAVYELTLPRTTSVPARLIKVLRSIAGPGHVLDTLAEQQHALARDYERLVRVRDDFRHVLEAIPNGVVIHRDGIICWVNAAVVSILGYDRPDEIVGKRVFSLLHPGDAQRLAKQLAQPIEAITGPSEYRILRKDGQTSIIEITPVREVEFGGRPARLVVGEDVTEERRMQEQLLIADRMAALGMVAASVAHEINNPLSFAVTGLEVATRALDASPVDTARARDALATVGEGLTRVRTIVGDLRTFSRPEGERVELVELPAVLDSTLQLAERAIEPRARVVREYGSAPPVHASRARLGQVFLNLLLNAAEALPERDPEHNLIRVRTSTDEQGRALVEIADTGAGVPEAESQRVFEPFFTTKRASKGTGLGLSVCHRIVTGYGGEIRVVSPAKELPFNTVFSVALPVA